MHRGKSISVSRNSALDCPNSNFLSPSSYLGNPNSSFIYLNSLLVTRIQFPGRRIQLLNRPILISSIRIQCLVTRTLFASARIQSLSSQILISSSRIQSLGTLKRFERFSARCRTASSSERMPDSISEFEDICRRLTVASARYRSRFCTNTQGATR